MRVTRFAKGVKLRHSAQEQEVGCWSCDTLITGFDMIEENSVVQSIIDTGVSGQQHAWGAFADSTLKRLEQVLPSRVSRTLETGCGKSTILFSNISETHLVFSFDDRELGCNSSVLLYENHPLTKDDRISLVPGPTQLTLPKYDAWEEYDIIMLDGPHGSPFLELEYYFTYPHLRKGGYLIIDDVHIPSIGQFADVIKEDRMFEYHALIENTLVLRRTNADSFDPFGDGWYEQDFNRRRIDPLDPSIGRFHLADGGRLRPMSQIVKFGLPFENILFDSGELQLAKSSTIFWEALFRGFHFRIGRKRFSISGRNAAKKYNIVKYWAIRIFGKL